jgi:colicin import membrane protein
METTADKIRALLLAAGVHLACVLVVVIGLFWTRAEAPLSVAGSPIEASLVSAPPASFQPAASLAQPVPAAPPPQPTPVPRPQQAETPPQPEPQAPVPRPDTREVERAAQLAREQAEEKAREEQQERRRQEQVLLEEERRQREAERRERLRQQELARERELAEIRRQREDAERQRRLEAERLQQITDQRSQAPPSRDPGPQQRQLGNEGTDDSLRGRYMLAIQQAVTRAWLRPEHVTAVQCRLRIIQIPGGEVISVNVLSPCAADELTRRSMEAAVLKAQPLPYSGFETVFSREATLTFCYPRERCQ